MIKTRRYSWLAAIALSSVIMSAASAQPTRQRIVHNEFVHADGCHTSTRNEQFTVPHANRLDNAYKGALPGIEIVQYGANGAHGVRAIHFVNGGKAVAFSIWATGNGHWQPPVCAFGHCVGGGWCINAAGAWDHVDVYAHYKQ